MKFKINATGVKQSDIKTLEQRLFLVRLYRNPTDPEGRLGFISGAEFCLENRDKFSLDDFKRHYKEKDKELVHKDSYESSYLYALKCNIQELENNKEGEF